MSSIRQIVIFLGAPGSGKGTLSRMCVDRLGWKQLSTGDLCRQHVQEGTDIGKEIDFTIKSGKLVRDSLIIEMVAQWLFTQVSGVDQTVILDGFPRTVVQAESFMKMINDSFSHVVVKVYQLVVKDSEIINRLSSRIVCSNKECQAIYSERGLNQDVIHIKKCNICHYDLIKRNDDAVDKIHTRLDNYHYHIGALLKYYQTIGIAIIDIDGNASTENVFEEVLSSERMIQ